MDRDFRVRYEHMDRDGPGVNSRKKANTLLSGFCREIQDKLSKSYSLYLNIPPSIITLCAMFYYLGEPVRVNVKLVLIGDSNVGKTGIAIRECKGMFADSSEPTLGASFLVKTVDYERFSIRFEIWDTAGQERFRALTPLYYRNAAVILIVFDLTDIGSFQHVQTWMDDVCSLSLKDEHPLFVVVGNKLDLENERKVTKEMMDGLVERNGDCLCFRVSAKTGENVGEMFRSIGMDTFSVFFSCSSSCIQPKKSQPDSKRLTMSIKTRSQICSIMKDREELLGANAKCYNGF